MPKNTDAVEMDIPEPDEKNVKPSASYAAVPPRTHEKSSTVSAGNYTGAGSYAYSPDTAFITRVEVHLWHTDYSYYEQFRASALKLREYEGTECPEIPFFSYMPQYSQMKPEQLAYYLYLRREIENGRYPHADYSYLLLLVYELINLSDVNSAEESVKTLCSLISGYGKEYPRLTVQLADWICDFCLINRCLPDVELLRPFMKELVSNSFLAEFYVGLDKNADNKSGFLHLIGGYDYTRSRFAAGDNKALYDRHMNGVLSYILEDEEGRNFFNNTLLEKVHVTRDSYVGALCSPHIKKRFVIDYYSFSRSYRLRFAVRDIQKYTENRLRAALGLRSRLSCGDIPDELLKLTEQYCSKFISRPQKKENDEPEYEKLYEPRKTELSLEAAAKIEELSWDTTDKFVKIFDNGVSASFFPLGDPPQCSETPEGIRVCVSGRLKTDSPAENSDSKAQKPTGNGPKFADAGFEMQAAENGSIDCLKARLSKNELDFLQAALDGDAEGMKRASKAANETAALTAERINFIASELYDDIILDDLGGFFAVIEDYADLVREELKK